MDKLKTIKNELARLINSHSLENGSDTPDFILAAYLLNCLAVFDHANNWNTAWHSKDGVPENWQQDGPPMAVTAHDAGTKMPNSEQYENASHAAESAPQLDAEDPAEQWTVVPDDEVGFVARSRKYSWCTGHGSTQEAAIKMASETLEELRCPNCGAPDGDPGAIDTPKTAPAAEPVEDVVDPITQLAMSLQWEELYTDEYKRRVLKEAIAAALVERRTK